MRVLTLWVGLMLCGMSCVSQVLAQEMTHSKSTQEIKKVLLVVAMDTEAAPIIKALHLQHAAAPDKRLPMRGYQGRYAKYDIYLVTNGTDPVYNVQNVGTQAATLSTYLGISHFHPDLVISIGTAGGIPEKNAKIGDVYVSQKIFFYGRRIPLPGYREYGLGGYTSATIDQRVDSLGFKRGYICSGDAFDENPVDRKMVLKNNCSVREMEAASVAWVSLLMHTPMVAIKGITDIEGRADSRVEFQKNFDRVNVLLAEKLKQLLSLF